MNNTAELEKEIKALKIKVGVLEIFLQQSIETPVLGPNNLQKYESDLNKALVKAGLA